MSAVRWRITAGPATRPIRSDVIAAITARNVRYWNTRRKPKSGPTFWSQLARLSSMPVSFAQDGFDDAFHLHETRPFDEHARRGLQFGRDGGIERIDIGEVAAVHCHGLRAEREELVDAPGARVVADFGVELRALRADLAHVAEHRKARRGQSR